MKIDNPKVTLADEARNGVQEEVRSGFLDWLYEFNVEGDDGESYGRRLDIVYGSRKNGLGGNVPCKRKGRCKAAA